MSELQEHEVSVENKNGNKMVVSAQYYTQNKGRLKLLDDNGLKNKMETLELDNKANSEPNEEEAKKKSEKK